MSDNFLPDPISADGLSDAPALRLASNGRRPTAAHAADNQPHLRDYLRVVMKRRHIAIAGFAVVALIAMVYAFTATPVYEGKIQLLIEADNPNVVNFKQVIDEEQSRQDYYQTQYKLLESRSLAKNTITALRLWDNPELTPQASTGFSFANAMRGATEWTSSLFGHDKTITEVPASDETVAQAKTVAAFLARLTVSPVRNSRLVEVSYRSTTAALAPRVANALGAAFIQQSQDFRFTATREASDWLNQQLTAEKAELEDAETKLQQYREANGALSLQDNQNIVVQKLADLNGAVTRAKTERLQKEAVYRQVNAIENDPTKLDTFPAILMNPFIQQQKTQLSMLQQQKAQFEEKLGRRHPDMIKLDSAIEEAQASLKREIDKVVQAVHTEYEAALAQEQSLTQALDAQKGEAMQMNSKAINYNVLDRDVQSNKQIYDSLLQRAKETGISGDLKTSNVRIVDNAEPSNTPVSPRRMLDVLIGLFGGAFIGVGLAFFFEYLDNRVKTPEEIEARLGIPSLGMIPLLSAKDHPSPLINNGVPGNFAEAFRGIRTNVLFSSTEDGSRSLVVTSTAPGEGKTMVASNLAIGIAQTGLRVLLIDADMRRPRAHELFGRAVEPGLSNLLVGATTASEAVGKTAVANLWFMPAGKTPPNPAELLGSKRFDALLQSMKPHFDYVVIDTPPVMAVTDATIAAHRASAVLFVIAADVASRQGAEAALDQLEHGRARFVGAVLNRVDLERNAYYYSRYYRKEYKNYYVTAAN